MPGKKRGGKKGMHGPGENRRAMEVFRKIAKRHRKLGEGTAAELEKKEQLVHGSKGTEKIRAIRDTISHLEKMTDSAAKAIGELHEFSTEHGQKLRPEQKREEALLFAQLTGHLLFLRQKIQAYETTRQKIIRELN